MAYSVACLGVTESDWRLLGWEALKFMNFGIARKAFIRVQDVRYIELVSTLEDDRETNAKKYPPQVVEQLLLAEICAYQGKFTQAAKIFSDCGETQRAIAMFADLRLWEEAKKYVSASNSTEIQHLLQRQAKWAEEINDWRAAAEMYLNSGNTTKASTNLQLYCFVFLTIDIT